MSFPSNFVWGVATAAYQIEGAATADGKGQSVWDALCRKEGAIWQGQSGAIACDHYHRYAEDVALMQKLGIPAYRLSVAWPRILPEGTGAINAAGMDFYERLIDALLAANITPYVTLFHWDYPYELYARGGWLNKSSPEWFADYVRLVVERLSDRVCHWITLNEPQCFIGGGHYEGHHAPGNRLALPEMLRAAHHCLLAHGRAVQVIRAYARTAPQIGYSPVGVTRIPLTPTPDDIAAARKLMFTIPAHDPVWNNSWWIDPVILGNYPEDGLRLYGDRLPPISPADLDLICQPLDFLGVNIYQGVYVRAGRDNSAEIAPFPTGHPLTASRWWVTPESLYWGPKFFYERYRLPLIITENGMSNVDWVALDGRVHDPQRIDFIRRYLLELHRALQDNVAVRGYFHWSFMDNFEWAQGYRERFGLVYVDYQTLQRIPKDSAWWYHEVIASNGNCLFATPDKEGYSQ